MQSELVHNIALPFFNNTLISLF